MQLTARAERAHHHVCGYREQAQMLLCTRCAAAKVAFDERSEFAVGEIGCAATYMSELVSKLSIVRSAVRCFDAIDPVGGTQARCPGAARCINPLDSATRREERKISISCMKLAG